MTVGRDSTDGDDGSFPVQLVPDYTHSPGIEHGFAVHQETILVMALAEHHLNEPPAIAAALHGEGLPMVEIAGQFNGFRLGCMVIEMNGTMCVLLPELRCLIFRQSRS